MKKALIFGILASMFFAFTFVFNRSINLAGGYWGWSASLRYFFMLPMLWIASAKIGGIKPILNDIKLNPAGWILWSTVGFGLFYAPLTLASVYGESWFIAATWQLTIAAGVLLTPLFGKRIPIKNLTFSIVILAGILLLQSEHLRCMKNSASMTAFALIIIAAFSYPLGNRKMMLCASPELSAIQRVFGMTLCSMPFWTLLSVFSGIYHGVPTSGQLIQSFIVALFSGVIATVLFFEATNLVKHNAKQLAVVEATQSGEVIFTLLGGIIFLGDSAPSALGFAGIALIALGMIANSAVSAKN